MTDKVTELAKKHGAEPVQTNLVKRGDGLFLVADTFLVVTPDQLRAIIKEASEPLVDFAMKSFKGRYLSSVHASLDAEAALAEFNKEFGE